MARTSLTAFRKLEPEEQVRLMWHLPPEAAAQKGARYLSRVLRSWSKRVSIKRLNIGCCYRCILGQLFGEYQIGKDFLGLNTLEARFLGLSSPLGETDRDRKLTEAWTAEIRKRRAAA